MTTQEIKDLVAAKIAGHGDAVDLGGALPEILNGILDICSGMKIPEFPGGSYQQISRADALAIGASGAVKYSTELYYMIPALPKGLSSVELNKLNIEYQDTIREIICILSDGSAVYDVEGSAGIIEGTTIYVVENNDNTYALIYKEL